MLNCFFFAKLRKLLGSIMVYENLFKCNEQIKIRAREKEITYIFQDHDLIHTFFSSWVLYHGFTSKTQDKSSHIEVLLLRTASR